LVSIKTRCGIKYIVMSGNKINFSVVVLAVHGALA